MDGLHVCSFTTFPDLRIVVGGKTFRFEWSDRFGPLMLGKRGEPLLTALPSRRSPFWRALHWWLKQGRRVSDGVCVYETVAPTRTRWLRVSRRSLVQDTPENRQMFAEHGIEPEIVEIDEDDYGR